MGNGLRTLPVDSISAFGHRICYTRYCLTLFTKEKITKWKKYTTPERFELSRGNPMYLAGTRLNHSAKATLLVDRVAVESPFFRKNKNRGKDWCRLVVVALEVYN